MKYNFDDGGAGKKKPAPKKSAAVKKTTATAAVKPANTRRRRTQKRHPALKLILMSMVVAAFAAIFVGGYVFFSSAQYVLGSQIMQLEEYKFAQARTTIIYAYQDHANRKKPVEIARLHGEENRIWVPYANIPDNVKNAFVALEDKRYFDHSGVDWIRTVGSATKYKMSQGGSTITQQLIKNLTGEKEVTIVRKIREILIALNMERFYSKEEILETYLNTVYMGNGTYGLYTATEVYFGKPMKDLTIAEAAVLSVITNAPTTYDPLRNPENVKRRQMVALKAMLEQGYITQKQYDKAAKQKLVYTNSKGYKPSNSTSVTVTKGEVTSS
ncbi:MAG: transglycosylase domain-containing protein, partial [Oscillospiraceae bacterium]|nr:transglycosylase domain-containing protein [Oscillospiraceae bacterium]